ncbi:MAG: serine hydrolase domain-containing protein [Cytophagales bacterium]|nr:serine hydrolase domain-containing protein [Cytophagales bacterium]
MKIIPHLSVILIVCCSLSCSSQPVQTENEITKEPERQPSESNLEQIKDLYSLEASYERFSGSVQVSHQGKVIIEEALGGTNSGITSGLETRFDIGSISKSFTAAAILSLVDEGNFKLQDRINTHLGAFASDRWQKVTVYQLLTHTSGIPSIYQTEQGIPIFMPEKEPIALKELIAKFSEGKLLFKPGSEFSYSNSGYVLLAAIIEQVSGQSYDQFMQREIFERYGLNSTSFSIDKNTAQPYFGYRTDLTRKAATTHWSWAIGAGGIQTNLTDLSNWLEIIQSDGFLNQELREAYLKQHESIGYGYGWQFANGKIQHDGGTAGYISFISFDPATASHVIVLSNRSFEAIDRFGESSNYIRNLVDKTWRILEGKSIETLPKHGKLSLEPTNFQFVNGTQINIRKASDSTYWVTGSNMTPSRIIPASALEGSSTQEDMMNDVAELLLRKKHWGLAKHCNGEMKFVCYSGLMGVGMKMIRKKTGAMQKVTAYFVEERYGLLRLIGDKQAADLIAYFDEEGKIKGIFENRYYPFDEVKPMLAYPTQNRGLFLDGFNIGEPDVLLEFEGDKVLLKQAGRVLEGFRVTD